MSPQCLKLDFEQPQLHLSVSHKANYDLAQDLQVMTESQLQAHACCMPGIARHVYHAGRQWAHLSACDDTGFAVNEYCLKISGLIPALVLQTSSWRERLQLWQHTFSREKTVLLARNLCVPSSTRCP